MKQEDYQELIKRKEAGLITMRKHPVLDLEIYNYTPKTQYNKLWDTYTIMCRGLILDSEHNILSKPFSKFFNLNEVPETTITNLPAEIPVITEKTDGVLGILYPESEKVAIASRGAFNSVFAVWATDWIRKKKFDLEDFKQGYTYCFEIIYPGSRVVVDYKGRSELVLLAVLNNKNKHELNHIKEAEELNLSYAKEFQFDDIIQAEKYLAEVQGINQEGFVCRYSNGLRLKIKSEDYRRLHKILTGFSAKDVWDALRQGKTLEALLNVVPDEFYQWVKKTESELQQSKNKIVEDAAIIFQEANKLSSRKEQARYILKSTQGKNKGLSGVVFCMLDGRNEKAEEAAWKIIEPNTDKVMTEDDV
ncbi:MAG: T4 RnlA family RNA ligase [Candidatus Methanoperedens sp.]